MKEYILCAAVHFDDGKEYSHQPCNIISGVVISGRRHHNCYATLGALGSILIADHLATKLIERTNRDRQGFITNLDRYVSREEAYIIAKDAGQLIAPKTSQGPILISEELY